MFGAPSILLNGNGRELVVIIKSQQNESIQNVIYFVKSDITELRVMEDGLEIRHINSKHTKSKHL